MTDPPERPVTVDDLLAQLQDLEEVLGRVVHAWHYSTEHRTDGKKPPWYACTTEPCAAYLAYARKHR